MEFCANFNRIVCFIYGEMKHKTPILQRADFFPQNIRRNRYNEQLNSVIFIAYPGLVGTQSFTYRRKREVFVALIST